MDREDRIALLKQFEEKILLPLSECLRRNSGRLKIEPIEIFIQYIKPLCMTATHGLLRMAGAPTLSNLDFPVADMAFLLIGKHLNGVLPATYPYCIGISEFMLPDGCIQHELTVFGRNTFPELRENTDPRTVPILRLTDGRDALHTFSLN